MFEKARSTWRSLEIGYRFYIAGAVLLSFWFFSRPSLENLLSFRNTIMWVGCALFGIGFLSWIAPWLKTKWKTRAGKWIISIWHVAVLFIAVFPSRLFVANALGLPPQDFELTVATVAILLYAPLWVVLAAVCTAVVGFLFVLRSMLSAMLAGFVSMVVAFVFMVESFFMAFNHTQTSRPILSRNNFFVQSQSKLAQLKRELEWKSYSTYGHGFGAIVISFLAGFAWDQTNYWISHHKFIKWVAYTSDFQFAACYPGVDANKRLRLHENGVVSYAEQDGWDIKITVGRVHQVTLEGAHQDSCPEDRVSVGHAESPSGYPHKVNPPSPSEPGRSCMVD